ncbi:MAG: monovalent cation/H(+) antiporter subunit G [Alphaproteobacteria bacterium]|nr:monovalent cation/H(+) antiporter subunit G [Alphaproteobacteria bacterium]MBO6629105.1 monovalent cation/H(+) antiporter subunit G [Alphaproteobacteria bacterium]|tara:strand:+ start:145 stop:489 length:345 start_codon:yes stop_codon:yes gene_type:complete
MIDLALDIASLIAFSLGGFFLIVGAIGMLRLPDFWSRLHGAGIIDTAGAELILLGMAFQSGLTLITVKLVLIGLFLFFTSPTGTHAVANAAYIAGLRPLGLVRDEPSDNEEGAS